MRILFITNNYTPYAGGVVSSINASINYLKANGHTVHLVTFQFLSKQKNTVDVTYIPSIYLWQYKKNYYTIPYPYQRIINHCTDTFMPDIIHVHHPFLLGQAGLVAAKKRMIPIVFTYHTQYEAYTHYFGPLRFFVRIVSKKIVHRFCKAVDHIIAPSSGIAHMLEKQGVQTPITVLPSALQNCFLSDTSKVLVQKNINKPVQLLYVGRLAAEKNVAFLFSVLSYLPIAYQLIIVGYGPDESYLKHEAYVKRGLSFETVIFIGKQTGKNLRTYYAKADIFLFPSQSDTQGLVLAEAMAQGCPVIALDGIGQRDIICNGKNGFIVKNAQEMAKKIIYIHENRGLFQSLQKKARQTARKYYPTYIGKKLVFLYKKLVASL